MNTYKNYIDLLRNNLKNFDNNEFDSIDNLYKKYYVGRYQYIKKKY